MPVRERRSLSRKAREARAAASADPQIIAGSESPGGEERLVERARDGDSAAFESLVLRYEQRIYALAFRMVGNRDDALDLTQECFIRAYKSLPRTAGKLNVSSWLHRIASNACLDVLRRRQRIRWLRWDDTRHEPLLIGHPSDDPERVALARESRSRVQDVLGKMNDRYRLALMLREYEGMSTGEIGEVMGVSRAAVKSALYRAREEFRVLYSAELGR